MQLLDGHISTFFNWHLWLFMLVHSCPSPVVVTRLLFDSLFYCKVSFFIVWFWNCIPGIAWSWEFWLCHFNFSALSVNETEMQNVRIHHFLQPLDWERGTLWGTYAPIGRGNSNTEVIWWTRWSLHAACDPCMGHILRLFSQSKVFQKKVLSKNITRQIAQRLFIVSHFCCLIIFLEKLSFKWDP